MVQLRNKQPQFRTSECHLQNWSAWMRIGEASGLGQTLPQESLNRSLRSFHVYSLSCQNRYLFCLCITEASDSSMFHQQLGFKTAKNKPFVLPNIIYESNLSFFLAFFQFFCLGLSFILPSSRGIGQFAFSGNSVAVAPQQPTNTRTRFPESWLWTDGTTK